MFLRSGREVIDNVLIKTRRMFNALKRPVGTSRGRNTVLYGYAPYNPAMLEKYVTIFRQSTTSCPSATTGRRRRCGGGSPGIRSSSSTSSGPQAAGDRARRRRAAEGSGWWWREPLFGYMSHSHGDPASDTLRAMTHAVAQGIVVERGAPWEREPCGLLPPEAFYGADAPRPSPDLLRLCGVDGDIPTGPESRCVELRLFSECAGWRTPPVAEDLYHAMRAPEPTSRQFARNADLAPLRILQRAARRLDGVRLHLA